MMGRPAASIWHGTIEDAERRLQGNPTKLYLVYWTFINFVTANTFAVCFVGRDNLAQRRCAPNLRQYHDHQHLRHLFYKKGQPRLEVKLQLDQRSS
jgi:hypothetical protein